MLNKNELSNQTLYLDDVNDINDPKHNISGRSIKEKVHILLLNWDDTHGKTFLEMQENWRQGNEGVQKYIKSLEQRVEVLENGRQ